MQLFKTGIKNLTSGITHYNHEFVGYQAAQQHKALAQAKLNRKGANWVAVVEPVTDLDLTESEEV